LEQVIRETDKGAPDSKSVWKRAFGMEWMGAVEMEMLHTIGSFNVNACLESIVLEPDIHIKESYVFPREGPDELDREGAVEVLQKCFQRLLSVGPDQENIVDVAKSGERFERCGVEVLGL